MSNTRCSTKPPGRTIGNAWGIGRLPRQVWAPGDVRLKLGLWEAEEEDCDLIIHSQQELLFAEVKGACRSHGACPTNYCACCGRSMHMTGCGHCGYLYRDDAFDTGGGPPINPTAQALIEKFGWKFAEDPQLARDEADLHKHMEQC